MKTEEREAKIKYFRQQEAKWRELADKETYKEPTKKGEEKYAYAIQKAEGFAGQVRELEIPTSPIPKAEIGHPEAGYQPSMVEEVPEKEVRPKGKSEVVQVSMDDQLKLEKAWEKAEPKKPVVKGLTTWQSVEELEQELTESEAKLEGLEETLAGSKAADLTGLVTKGGKMRGHLTGLTPLQYEKYLGRKPPPGLLVKAKDATTRKVQWDKVLDQLASERGYAGE